jgi:hypothetical protein
MVRNWKQDKPAGKPHMRAEHCRPWFVQVRIESLFTHAPDGWGRW